MDPLPDHIADLIRQGRTIEAIKLIREETGVGLAEAKEAVEALARGQDPLAEGSFEPFGPDEEIPADIRALAIAGQKIEAIKQVRERTGLGLKESKELVESIPGVPASKAAPGCAVAVLVLLIGMGVAFFLWASGCAPAPVTDRAGGPVTAGPVHAGPMVAPSDDDLTGSYRRAHTIEVFDGDDWTPRDVEDTLMLRQSGDSLVVEFVLLHTNVHLCEFEGTAVRDGDGFAASEVITLLGEKDICTLRVTATPDSITLHDEGAVCRTYYCGARGAIDGTVFAR